MCPVVPFQNQDHLCQRLNLITSTSPFTPFNNCLPYYNAGLLVRAHNSDIMIICRYDKFIKLNPKHYHSLPSKQRYICKIELNNVLQAHYRKMRTDKQGKLTRCLLPCEVLGRGQQNLL